MIFKDKLSFEKYFHFLDEYHSMLENFIEVLLLEFICTMRLSNAQWEFLNKKVELFCDRIAKIEDDYQSEWINNTDLIPQEYTYLKIYLIGEFHKRFNRNLCTKL